MAIQPRDLHDLAAFLAQQNGEAALRAAISRAYYACFHAVISLARQKNIPPSNRSRHRGEHQKRIGGLEEFGVARGPQGTRFVLLAKQLWNLKTLREEADYQLDLTMTVQDRQQAMVQADRLMDLTQSLAAQS